MNFRNKVVRGLSGWGYALGVLLGLWLFGLTVWSDFEASLYDAVIRGDENLEALECPVLIAPWETGTITATLTNPLDRDIDPRVRAHITAGFVTLMEEEVVTVELAPGETANLGWQVTAEDAAFGGLLILTRVYMFRNHGLPSRDASCGILVLDALELSGRQIYNLSFVGSILLMLIGLVAWSAASWPLTGEAQFFGVAMLLQALIVAAGLIVSMQGWILAGIFLLILAVLLIAALVYSLTK